MLLAATLLALLAAPSWPGAFDADEDAAAHLPFKSSGLVDVRYARTSQQRGWREGGSNKLRYGGKDIDANGSGDRSAHVFALPKAALLLDFPVLRAAEAHLHLDVEGDNDIGDASVGLIEAFGVLEERRDSWAGRVRVGAFIPPISWEHPEAGWGTRYTLTPSAIGSWIGEEVRAFGAEATTEYAGSEHLARFTGAVFSGSDQSGHILLYRGWALHDYTADLGVTYNPGGAREYPFRELDGRPGFYGRLETRLLDDLIRVGGGYWDNNGDLDASVVYSGTTLFTWRTRFWDGGARLAWRRLTLIAQFMRGDSASLPCPRWDWQAWFALASYEFHGGWRASGRYDRFQVNQRRWEDAYALTGALQWDATLQQRLSLEYVYVLARPSLSVRPSSRKDQIAQLNYRFRWGGR